MPSCAVLALCRCTDALLTLTLALPAVTTEGASVSIDGTLNLQSPWVTILRERLAQVIGASFDVCAVAILTLRRWHTCMELLGWFGLVVVATVLSAPVGGMVVVAINVVDCAVLVVAVVPAMFVAREMAVGALVSVAPVVM